MKFRINYYRELIAEEKELQPAFVKGVLAAHEDKPNQNPYTKKSYRDAYNVGYAGVKDGKIAVEE